MNTPFTIDGVAYNVIVPAGGLKRSFEVLDGKNAGRLLSGRMVRDIIGTYYNYELQIETIGPAEYDALYEVLSSPIDSHLVSLPYGQGTLTFKAYVTSGGDTLSQMYKGKNYWQGLTVKFIAEAPQRT